jgi:hypothetical protein
MTADAGLVGLFGFFEDKHAVFRIVSALPRGYVIAHDDDEVSLVDEAALLGDARLFVSEHAALVAATEARSSPPPAADPTPTPASGPAQPAPVRSPDVAAPSAPRQQRTHQ